MADINTAAVPLTVAAQRLGISWPRAWRLVLTGALAGFKRDGRWFVAAASLDALIAATGSAVAHSPGTEP